jgi:hypothetical protein
MSGLIGGGGKTISTSETKIEALKLQSSAYGVTIPIVYGVNRIPGNLIWYGGFQAIPHTTESSAGKGGSVKTQSTTYTYTASVAMALCEGQIRGVPRTWRGKKLYDGGFVPGDTNTATETFSVPGGGGDVVVAHAATIAAAASVHAWLANPEHGGSSWQWMTDGFDYTRDGGTYTFPANSRAAGTDVQITYQWVAGTSGNTGLDNLGLTFFDGQIGQSPWTVLSTDFPDQAVGYSGIAYVAGQNYDLGSGAAVDNHTFEVQGPLAYSISTSTPDANPATLTQDILTNDRFGAALPSAMLGDMTEWSNYCLASGILLSPALTEQMTAADFVSTISRVTNVGPVWSSGRLKMISYGDANLSANGATFVANTTPEYDLTDDDFIDLADPIKVTRKQQSDCYNHIQLEYLNRDNLYNIEICDVKDQASIDAYSLRTMPVIRCHWICKAAVAAAVAQLLLQRSMYIRNEYSFKLPWTKVMLEPMDLVTLTDPVLYSRLPVRIIKTEESEDGELSVVAEDFPLGVASATAYPRQAGIGFAANYNESPGNARAPVIFELPGELITTSLAIAIATGGLTPAWGGCEVWASYDGDSYVKLGEIFGGSRYGVTTGPIDVGTLPVRIHSGQLSSVSGTGGVLGTLCYIGGVDQEFIAYTTATLTGNLSYSLSGLARGAYQTNVTQHEVGAPFVRMDDAIAESGPLDVSLLGKTVFVKLCSFNVYGGARQTLDEVQPYSYLVTGVFMGKRQGRVQFVEPVVADGVSLRHSGASSTYSGLHWSLLGTIRFTAQFNATGVLVISGTAVFDGSPSVFSDKYAAVVNVAVDWNADGVVDAGEYAIQNTTFVPTTGISVHTVTPIGYSRSIEVAAGETYTWPIYAQTLEGVCVIEDFQAALTPLMERVLSGEAAFDIGALGWPGAIVNGVIVGGVIADIGTLTWDTIPDTWDAWDSWDGPSYGEISYEHPAIDLGSVLAVKITEEHAATGTVQAQYKASSDGVFLAGWSLIPITYVTGRFFKFRWVVTGSFPVLSSASVVVRS